MACCNVEGCTSLAKRVGMCTRHYSRVRRYGNPHTLRQATKTEGVSPAFKKAWVIAYKLEHGCADCGYKAHHAALDFDHRPGTSKVRDIKSGQQLGWVALQEEVAKCDVVCANCHRIRTFVRRAAEGGDVNE